MALGERNSIQLLTAATATNGVPTASSDGLELNSLKFPEDALLTLRSTAGSGTMTVNVRLWGYEADSAKWFPLGVGADSTKGTIDSGTDIAETSANQISHAEIISGLRHFDRIYAEITAITGTSTAISCWLIARV